MHIEVIDTGIGMSDEQQEKLFQPCSQSDASVTRNFGGTGLSLAISKRLAQRLGGEITASSTESVGSTFTVSISTGNLKKTEMVDYTDVSRNALASGSSTNEPGANARRLIEADKPKLTCRVLVVDDRRDIHLLSKRLLTKAGATVDECEDGQLAVEHMTDCIGKDHCPDLILLDMQMPNLDGYDTARTLQKLG